jgi:hypothetical protein
MARFEVYIPASEPDGLNMTLRVTADTWMAALKVGLKKIGEAQGMPKDVLCDIQDDESIHVTDPRTSRVFRILQIPDVSNPGLAPAALPKSPWMSAPADPHPSAPNEHKTVPDFPAPTPAEIDAAVAAQKAADKLAAQRAEAAKKALERAVAEKLAAEAAAAERAAAEAQAAAEKEAAEKAAEERAAAEARLAKELAAAERAVAKAKAEREASEKNAVAQKAAEKAAASKAADKAAKARIAADKAAAEAKAAAEQAEADQIAHEQAAADQVNAERVAEMARAAVASQNEKTLPPSKPRPASSPALREKEHPVTVKVVDKPKAPPPAQIGRLQPTAADTQQVEDTLSELFERTPELFQKAVPDALYYLLDLAMEKVPVDSGTVYVADLNRRDLGFAAVRGPKAKELLALKLRVPMGKGFVGFCAQEGVAIAISDVQRDKRFFREISDRIGYDTKSMITTPIILHGRTLGAIQLINKKGSSSFTQAELSILHYLAHQGALLLEAAE